jgi:hypothetical protein
MLLINPHTLTCSVKIGDWQTCTGVQKILGFSRGWHHWNSIRLGYNRSEGEDIRLFMYVYRNGQRIIQRLGYFKVGEQVSVSLNWGYYIECRANDKYAFRVAPKRSFPIGYMLNSYAEKDGVDGVQVPINIEIMNLRID